MSGAPALLSAVFRHGKAANVHTEYRSGARKIAQGVKKVERSVFRFVRDGGKLLFSVRFNNAS